MARGAVPSPLDPSAASADPDVPPSSALPPTPSSCTTPTLPILSPRPTEYCYSSTSDMDLLHSLNTERERRYKAEADLAVTKAELANTQAKLEAAEKALKEFRDKPWASTLYDAAEKMGPGGALIATVGAPVLAAPLAVATVVKGFQSVGSGIGSLFTGKGGKGGDARREAGTASGS
ncbi:hypothetical protein L211DRAFT_666014 [Terfezia boudieri ATCC MYA-4762]|uniref:Uncharacterized protein n=1 Tax=Terfezia boudieri ATCC MYA-4762 TaxID=1051890 RepID=A0A3N4LMD3_9PEZI|nr:hypothetical protein L211DRAFT_666014 [Terfezia boudieri ATCC MYA-4762]